MYRTSKESTNSRRIKKLKGPKTWFRKRRNSTDAVDEEERSVARSSENTSEAAQESDDLDTKSVLLVEFTPVGLLAKKLCAVLRRLESIVGGKIKVVERTCTSLARMFSLTWLWEGVPC